jgi:hypothetical protein
MPRTPERVCDALMDLARAGAGPPGVSGWQDDRTVLAFVIDADANARRDTTMSGRFTRGDVS